MHIHTLQDEKSSWGLPFLSVSVPWLFGHKRPGMLF